ncbi:MAG: extracellular catalytic domain type 1 short-chain-length polyhydroxyalkanoate depolymerase [Planctomycetota bacterium]|jgi:polyhydroxybutyrate depolymerase
MKKIISIQCSTFHISWRRMIFVFVILSFVFLPILHAEIQNGSFDFDGRTRNYMVYLPTNYTGSINFPLVICLHPYGWGAQRMMNYTNMNQVANASDFIVVYPSAIPNWNSGVAENPSYPTPDVDDVGFINALIDTMINSYSIDPERIYACGYSNGGFMSYKLACQLSHRIAAIAPVGAVIATSTSESCSPLRTVPVLHIFGTADPYVPINSGTDWYSVDQTLSVWTNFNNCVQVDTTILPDLDPTDGCTVEKITYKDCNDKSYVVYYKVINGGHTWPGAGPAGYQAGNTNQDINANVEIWNFFKNYKLFTPPVVDLNSDRKVDFKDFSMSAQYWYQAQSPFSDHRVDFKYLAVLAENWLRDSRLIAHWKLDETEGTIAYDSIGSNNGTINGDPNWQPTADKVDGALEFDGIDDYVSTPFILNPYGKLFSVFTWIKGGEPGEVVISQMDGTMLGASWLCADSSGGKLMTKLMDPQPVLVSEYVITDSSWHHIGLVWDGSCRYLYADGAEVARDTDALSYAVPCDGGLHIGTGKDIDADSFWFGLIDDVCIYNQALSAEEIEELAR